MTNKISRIFGRFASYAFPKYLQILINKVYVRIFKIDLSDFDDLKNYPTLNALFTRSLRVPRVFDCHQNIMIAPTDSLITEFGAVQNHCALQIKGMSYCVEELLGEALKGEYTFVNFYLSPSDYHRYHSPCDMEVLYVRYFGGELLPVNLPSLKKNQNLFIKNERVVVVARDKNGEKFFFVAIGALNVGKMSLHFEPSIKTNALPNQMATFNYQEGIKISKGEEMGMFEMGSTVVLFAKNFKASLQLSQKLKFGDSIGSF